MICYMKGRNLYVRPNEFFDCACNCCGNPVRDDTKVFVFEKNKFFCIQCGAERVQLEDYSYSAIMICADKTVVKFIKELYE